MHQALLVPEILLYIFAHVKQIGEPSYAQKPLSRQSLAALATTCKIFYEPAMDFLWADMNMLLPLLGCVTRLHPMIYPSAQQSWSLDIEPLSELERGQFLRHSGRVRSLSVSSDDDFHLLYALPFDTCVFPNLLSLSWVVISTRYLRFFLSPTLRTCYIAIVQPELGRNSIGTRCPALEGLDIDTMGVMAQASHLSETVCSCKALVRLQCPPLDSAAWKHLSTVLTLLSLSIYQESFSNPPSKLDTHNLSFVSFLNVTSLHFCYAPIADITAVIQHSEFPSLKEFELVASILPGEELLPLLQALSQCKACHTLEKIDISDDDPKAEEPTDNSFAVTRVLLCFTQLRALSLCVSCSINPDNALLVEAFSSWPQLCSLSFPDLHHRPPKVTFLGLFEALRQCPHVHSLLLDVDVINIDIDPKVESFQHTSLKRMGIYPSPAADPEAVARIIFAMLPNVHLADTWGDVNTHLKSLRASSSLQGEDGD
ncbi:uncharacterized protein BJ212DRAFT_376433 [Suillus subaureus]|uniref:F-box domain-containing protein n=1 Tax=Suillus subaureus TaxID=48587 RepID=A0A9P7E8T9_9AGAM|nr:uncharacterized protein BJ212DRAFT_376433 [Suillus subaureus]KAG1813829.1 hypothetical protein BJ212DRAFT_376433 [Suillus subaureus]